MAKTEHDAALLYAHVSMSRKVGHLPTVERLTIKQSLDIPGLCLVLRCGSVLGYGIML